MSQTTSEYQELQSQLDSLLDKFILRMHDAKPPDCPTCQDTFEQWRDAFELGMKHPDNPPAYEHAGAALNQYLTHLKTHGIKEYERVV